MLRSMYSGISGMKNFQTKLDVIGNNIANVNTYGFKKGRVTFKDTMNQTISSATSATANRGGQNPMQIGLGGTVATVDTIHTQSSLQTTGRPLDLGISGDGYFVVKQGDAVSYTRAGNFYLDGQGTLVTADGLKVQSYDPKTGKLSDISVNVNGVLPSTTTKNIVFTDNLSSDPLPGDKFSQQAKIVDSLGKEHTVTLDFTKTSATTWDLSIDGTKAQTIDFSGATATPPTPAVITPVTGWAGIDFDGDGTITAAKGDIPASSINFDVSALTQLAGPTTVISKPDGHTEGSLESYSIGPTGEISGVYSNGQIESLGTIALAKFSNPSGLMKEGGNTFRESINSGTPDISIPGDGRGSIVSGSLEMSNVDLSEEFTEMIVAERGFQANTRIITTSDQILQELVNLKR